VLNALGGLDHLDHACPVVGQGVMHGFAAEDLEELFIGRLGLGVAMPSAAFRRANGATE